METIHRAIGRATGASGFDDSNIINRDLGVSVPATGLYTVARNSPFRIGGGINRISADTFDLDAEGNTTEAWPFDLVNEPRV